MWKGFRQNHPTKDDERFCIITFVHPSTGKRVYSRLRGLPFGMGSVVNQFNRLPHLKTAVLRRLFGLLACHYFDDELLLEMAGNTRSSATMIKSVANLWGIRYSATKSQPLSTWTAFLGHQYDWAGFVATSGVAFGVKESTKNKTVAMIQQCLTDSKLTPGSASKLRGLLTWLDSGLTGRPCRGALSALVARQYWERVPGHTLTSKLKEALTFLMRALDVIPSRVISLSAPPQNQVIE